MEVGNCKPIVGDGATSGGEVTHTGEVTGAEELTVDKTAITGKDTVTADSADYVMISDTGDSGNLKKSLVSDFGGGSSPINDIENQAIINSGYPIDQYAHITKSPYYTLTSSQVYVIDRHEAYRTGSIDVRLIFTADAAYTGERETAFTGRKGARFTVNVGGSGNIMFSQKFSETVRKTFIGNNVIFSGWVNYDRSGKARLNVNTISSSYHGGAGWELLTVTMTASEYITAEATGTVSCFLEVTNPVTSDVIEYSDHNFNKGSTREIPVTRQNELRLCQHYFFSVLGSDAKDAGIGAAFCFNSSYAIILMNFPCSMRVPPTLGFNTVGYFSVQDEATPYVLSSLTLSAGSAGLVSGRITGQTSGMTAGHGAMLLSTNAASILYYDSEI